MNKRLSDMHKRFMHIAIEEAKKGLGRTYPNPSVGCVIVKDGKVIARGYHKRFGGPHAEIIALKKAKVKAKGATLYVTLEPCSHFGKTPPCTDAIIRYGIKEVVASMKDANPVNNGKGFNVLRKNGIRVVSGVLKKEAMKLNKGFIDTMKRKRPFITLKMAQSLDGKIATKTGDSRWISSSASRRLVHKLRSKHDAIMVGINTLLRDNPSLNIRCRNGSRARQPVKIVVDSTLRTPPAAKIFSKGSLSKVIIAASRKAPESKEQGLKEAGAEVIRLNTVFDGLDMRQLARKLSGIGIGSVLVEGGGELAASLLNDGLIDKLYLFTAPIIIGGRGAITSVEGTGAERVKDALRINNLKLKRIGEDILIEGNVYRNN